MAETKKQKAETILALDFGSVYTRALLFDVVEGQYHFIGVGTAPSTVIAPFFDVGECSHHAIDRLQEITGRVLLSVDYNTLLIPSQPDGTGVDRLVVTISAGSTLSLVATGLLKEVSLKSIKRLAATTYAKLAGTIGLNDNRPQEEYIDAITRVKPEIILISGGTEGGATRSVLQMVDFLAMTIRLIPKDKRPVVIFAGNKRLASRVKKILGKMTVVYPAPNVRPTLETENINPANKRLAEIIGLIRTYQIGGLEDLHQMSGVAIMPTAFTFGRMIRFLSAAGNNNRGVMGVDLGAGSTTIAAARSGHLMMNVLPFGVGDGLKQILETTPIEEITHWIARDVPEGVIRDYLWHKTLYPAAVPMTNETAAIEYALTRYLLQRALRQTRELYPSLGHAYEPILITGSSLTQMPTPAHTMLAVLDGLQPVGISTIAVDQNGVIASLGAIAPINKTLPTQVIESGAFFNLGTVICPVSDERPGRPILHMRVERGKQQKIELEVKQGTLTVLPLRPGQTATMHIHALRGTRVDFEHERKSISLKVTGAACGTVIDARGRPLQLPTNPAHRRKLLIRWMSAFKAFRTTLEDN